MSWSPEKQAVVRQDIFAWLERQEIERGGYEFSRDFLRTAYSYQGHPIRLMDRQAGICNPKEFDETLSITTTMGAPYDDEGTDLTQKYSYERLPGRSLLHGRNKKLRAAAARDVPLIMFEEVLPARYVARYPVYIERDDPEEGYVYVELDRQQKLFRDPLDLSGQYKRYAKQVVTMRLHQKSFRTRVLHAYRQKCAICELGYPELLDAAHITPDWVEHSTASVTNGLALCKIHHAAYDRHIVGVDGEYQVHVREDILHAQGSPMLRYGIQEMDRRRLLLPRHIRERPDQDRLHERYLEFLTKTTV